MRGSKKLLLMLVVMLGVSPAAAVELAYDATIAVDVLDDLFVMVSTASGTVEVDADGSFSLPAGILQVDEAGEFDENTPRDIIPENVIGVEILFENGVGSFVPEAGGFAGSMGTLGSFDFYGDDPIPFVLPLILDPLGQGGTSMDASLGFVTTTLVGQTYTTGTATVTDVIVGDMTGQSLERTGRDVRSPAWTGAIRLVAGARGTIDGGMAFGVDVPIFATLDVEFTALPEPGATAQLGAGLLVLGWARLARLRSRARPDAPQPVGDGITV